MIDLFRFHPGMAAQLPFPFNRIKVFATSNGSQVGMGSVCATSTDRKKLATGCGRFVQDSK